MISRVLRTEIARAEIDPRNVLFSGEPRIEDPVLRGQLGGKFEIYRRLLDEPQISSKFDQRVQAVIGKERVVEALSDEEPDEWAKMLCEWWIEFGSFDEMCRSLLQAIILGRSHAELIWDSIATPKKLINAGYPYDVIEIPVEVRPKAQEFFSFSLPRSSRRKNAPADTNLLPQNPPKSSLPPQIYKGFEMRVAQDTLGAKKIVAPIFKFITHSFGSLTDNPNGHGLGGKLYWLAILKKDFVKYWALHADKFASPGMIGEFPENGDPAILEEFFEQYQGGKSWATLPENYKVHLLEAVKGGNITTYLDFLNWCDRQMSSVLTGQTFGPEVAQGLTGQPAKIDDQIRNEWVQADCDLLAPNLRKMLFYPITVLNLAGAETPFFYWDTADQENLNTRSERDDRLFKMGYRLKPEAVARIYGDDYYPVAEAEAGAEGESAPPPDSPNEPELPPGPDSPGPGGSGDSGGSNGAGDPDSPPPDPGTPSTSNKGETEVAHNILIQLSQEQGEPDSQEAQNEGKSFGGESLGLPSAARYWEDFISQPPPPAFAAHSDSLATEMAEARFSIQALSAVEFLAELYNEVAARISRSNSYSVVNLSKIAIKVKPEIERLGEMLVDTFALAELTEQETVYLNYQPDLATLTWDDLNRLRALKLADALDFIKDIPDALGSFAVLRQVNLATSALARLLVLSMLDYAYSQGSEMRKANRKERLQILKDNGWSSKFGELTSYKARLGLQTPYIRSLGAGRKTGLEEVSGKYPFWMWRQNTVVERQRRPEHVKLAGLCLSASDPFWQLYFPPQLLNCICDVIPVRQIPGGSTTQVPQEMVNVEGVPVLAVQVDLEDEGRRLIPISAPGFMGTPNSRQGRTAPIDALKHRLSRWT